MGRQRENELSSLYGENVDQVLMDLTVCSWCTQPCAGQGLL